ncbi:FxsA family protein [Knoellia aerolata]|uniref:Exlusion protein FxsA n=1 Tax=Knoellia aerolata DSM 18566 TaxID=1385519 RepID=A0A0A0K1J1_9MICO|nr:FxsA family protein [Knoellia aerolata]KGN42869.1 exlusion protein FxsA [Knoellia aerolata DSM 18566]
MTHPIGSTPYARRRRRPRWLTFVLIGLVAAPIIEIAVLVAVGRTIGVGWTLLALLLLTVLGTWLMRREGSRTWKALREASRTGRMPSREIADGALVLIGGAFLLLPGFVSDVIGLFFVLPFTRVFARRLLEAFVASRVLVRMPFPSGGPGGPGGPRGPGESGPQGTIRGEVVD